MPQLSDSGIRSRYRATLAALQRADVDEATARLVASVVMHVESGRQVRVEHAELMALCAVMMLVTRNLADRASREPVPEALARQR